MEHIGFTIIVQTFDVSLFVLKKEDQPCKDPCC